MSHRISSLRRVGFLLAAFLPLLMRVSARGEEVVRSLSFNGVLCERRLSLKELGADMPADWSDYSFLVLEMRTSTPQRFGLWVYTGDGVRRIEIQPFGQNVWLRASIPLQYFKGMDKSGNDLASTNNRRTNSFWMSVWGPWGELNSVEGIGLSMDYPINNPTIELRAIHLSRKDEGSEFLEKTPVTDEFGQWVNVDYPRKIKSREQLDRELAEEEKTWGSPADYGYGKFGGYQQTQAKATGFFRVEQIDGVWWFVDPEGHLFLSTSSNGITGPRNGKPATQSATALNRTLRRLDSWGMNTGGQGRPNIVFLRWNTLAASTFLGLPDVYSDDFATGIDQSAREQCAPRKDDPLIIGYFIGNEPPWGGRETEVIDLILKGPDTATKAKLKDFLARGDTPKRRTQFVIGAFQHYLDLVCTAVKKYDPNHLNLGIRFGGNPAAEVLRTARIFDVCSINVYEYEPTKQLERTYRLTGRPILIGEFHIGVPENGLGSGLVQAMNQTERGIGYRYFVEQGMSLPYALGAHWFTWRDEPVLGRMDGENYNIGFVDSTDRPYPELVDAAKLTHKRLFDLHSAKILPFSRKPKTSEAGTPSSPWGLQ
ncbi:MAG: hypothetical protein M3O30_08955 [Planctomycetota bacterium]|nr:hypothetical protein [Planctomycetota bacterium]